MADIFSLKGKRALITGGGTGLGLGIAKAMVEAGAEVIITGRREDVLKSAVEELGSNATYVTGDIADLPSLPGLVAGVAEGGKIDVLVNNAGINMKKQPLEVTDEEFARIVQTNLNGLFAMCREVGKVMQKQGSGSIINISSMAAIYGLPLVAGYASSKTAVVGLTRTLASDLAPLGIRVNAIAPGFIESEMTKKALDADPQRKFRAIDRTPMGVMGKPEDIGYAAVYLASDAAKFVTGVNLPVDGGNSIGF
ncbi:glucose 1-dehydrogenase [Pollutibacter soli]|uniref:SDR family NAD(P)-dependent oxidoreductase n=1 Tax=Pollutibacter soli TaxID=3034157 RepID=UPI003013E7F2